MEEKPCPDNLRDRITLGQILRHRVHGYKQAHGGQHPKYAYGVVFSLRIGRCHESAELWAGGREVELYRLHLLGAMNIHVIDVPTHF